MRTRALFALAGALASLALAGTGAAAVAGAGSAGRGGDHDPAVDPGSFGRAIDNPYFPLEPGTVFFYEGRKDGKVQTDRMAVTRRTKTILGVPCVVVLDVVSVGGKPVERTHDWYTQDARGNVWYFGEDSRDYEHGRWVRSDGSWQAGVDGAQPGIIMESHPRKGDVYRQELYAGRAEDMAQVLGRTHGWLTVPYGTFRHALVTREWSPLEPGISGRKYYARGVGLVQERSLRGESEHMKLVAVLHR